MSHQERGRLRTDRAYRLDDPPDVVWRALEQVEAYPSWWPWLRRFEAGALTTGERWRARIAVPMPWDLRFAILLDDVDSPWRVAATVEGDIEGPASITVSPDGDGSAVRLESALLPRHRLLRLVNRWVPVVSRRLHDRVVDQAFRQFDQRARPGGPSGDR